MVVKRQCSFCAGEVEPGTGTMYVKRDGTVFYFCSASCRKQQLGLGRVGHRLKWTHAHALKRAQAQSTARRSGRRAPTIRAAAPPTPPPAKPDVAAPSREAPAPPPAAAPAPSTAPPAAAEAPPAAPKAKPRSKPRSRPPAPKADGAAPATDA